ncbi:hypothetical protein AWB76_01414 [Caballeronia temeraria]|uniref:Uncharacterized protein n=1 Tax=Caballeronia temeraria TaxID=1777137 RepID=A0A157ZX92_9BURK|nr:hypothetical protein AWB76_01414 [Caballeronia temeraria]
MTRRFCILLFVSTYLLGCFLAANELKESPVYVIDATLSILRASSRDAIADANQHRRDEIERFNLIRYSRPSPVL